MAQITKLENGIVVIAIGSVKHSFQSTMQVLSHPSEEDFIIITDDSNEQETSKGFKISWKDVT